MSITQLRPSVAQAQSLPRVDVNWKRTGILREVASERAVCKPVKMASAVLRMREFCSQSEKAGAPKAVSSAAMVKAIITSIMFKPRWRLQAENLFLRHQLGIALRRAPPRFSLHNSDRALVLWMTRE